MTTPKRQLFTVTIYSENCVGLVSQVSSMFTRRCINIEDVTASASSVPDIHKLTLTTWADAPTMDKLVRQIEKRVDVIKAFLYTDDDIVYQEIALYKVDTSKLLAEQKLEVDNTPPQRPHPRDHSRIHSHREIRPSVGDRSPSRPSAQIRHQTVCAQRTRLRHQVARRVCRPLP